MDFIFTIAKEFWGVLGEMGPYLLFGFLVAGALSVLIPPLWVERHLGGRGFWPVVKASALGVPLPLCSCGVIPVAASLRKHGASRAATTAFLLSTPQTGVDSILVTLSLLGVTFAIYRPLAALATGLLGGWVVMMFASRANNGAEETPPPCNDSCCSTTETNSKFRRALKFGFVSLPEGIGATLLIGVLVAALLSAVIPENFFADTLGKGVGSFGTMLAVALLGIPVYVCATASIPVALALMTAGVSPGAALVFLMTGPATNAAAIATIAKIMGKRVAALYLATVAGTAIAAGMFLDYVYSYGGGWQQEKSLFMLPEWFKTVCAIALLAVLAYSIISTRRGSHEHHPKERDAKKKSLLLITGMTCSHCAAAVSRVLTACAGVNEVDVDLKNGIATIWGDDFDVNILHKAIDGLGYSASESEHPCDIHNDTEHHH